MAAAPGAGPNVRTARSMEASAFVCVGVSGVPAGKCKDGARSSPWEPRCAKLRLRSAGFVDNAYREAMGVSSLLFMMKLMTMECKETLKPGGRQATRGGGGGGKTPLAHHTGRFCVVLLARVFLARVFLARVFLAGTNPSRSGPTCCLTTLINAFDECNNKGPVKYWCARAARAARPL